MRQGVGLAKRTPAPMTDFRESANAVPIESVDQLVEQFHRAGKARERWIEFQAFEPVPGTDDWRVRIRTEHGTYVKEVINGEDGSTTPSLSEWLGQKCQCVELDVVAILDGEGREEAPRPVPQAFGQNV